MSHLPTSGNPRRPLGRRGFLGLVLAGAAGTAADLALPSRADAIEAPSLPLTLEPSTVDFYGEHQAGIATAPPPHATLVAFALHKSTTRASLGRLLRVWTGTIEALTAGRAAPGDSTPYLASPDAHLTITVGVGPHLIKVAGRDPMDPTLTLPPFPIDALETKWSGGDLVVQVCADDATTVTHASRMLVRDAAPFATPTWRQSGFSGGRPDGTTRNLLGHVEGTGNHVPGTEAFDAAVWRNSGTPEWFIGGTTMLVRRIRFELDTWDRLLPGVQDQVIGRRASNGAPRGKDSLVDAPDFNQIDTESDGPHVHDNGSVEVHAKVPSGLAIPENAHIRRAHAAFNDGQTIFRRGWSYAEESGEQGLMFVSFQADLEAYITIQNSLAALDALNTWTTPIGSAVFAVLPGCQPGDWLGRALVDD